MSLKPDKETAFRYFLGKMPAAEESRYEELYFTDAAVLQQSEIAQDELMEAYLSSGLSESDRALFDTVFLASPAHRKKVEIMRGLFQSGSIISNRERTYSSVTATLRGVSQTPSLF